jgi:transketolase C-terminal domain/subunit
LATTLGNSEGQMTEPASTGGIQSVAEKATQLRILVLENDDTRRQRPSRAAVEDLALMYALPGVGVVVPTDEPRVAATLRAVLEGDGPFSPRCSRYKSASHALPGTRRR